MVSTDCGYVKIHRKILEWGWYKDINTFRLFIHMLLKANWKDGQFKGTTVPRGSFVSSIDKLSEETVLTKREIRTAISHLKSTGEVTVKTTNKYSVFTVQNYNLYQTLDIQKDEQETDGRHSNDILTTTIEEGKKEKKEILICSPAGERQRTEEDFEIIYALYPKKIGKAKAYEYYLGWLKGRTISGKKWTLTNKQMYLAVKRYVTQQEEEAVELKFYKGFDTFMNKAILDYLEEEE